MPGKKLTSDQITLAREALRDLKAMANQAGVTVFAVRDLNSARARQWAGKLARAGGYDLMEYVFDRMETYADRKFGGLGMALMTSLEYMFAEMNPQWPL